MRSERIWGGSGMSFKNTDIGLIPSEWDFDTIGDSLYIKGRIGWKGLKKSEYVDRSDYRIINGSNIVNNNIDWSGCGYISEERYEESPEIMLKPNDIVMTKDGTIGKLAIIRSLEQKTTVASGLFVIRVEDNSIDVDYLYYYFSSFYFKELIKSRIEGSVIPHLYQKDLVALKLPLPDLSEQKAISKILRTLDDKIEVNNQINKTLENMAQTIFKQWFVDFEFPNEDGEPYKSSGGEMIESELGMIPKGWEVGSIYSIADIIYGAPFSSKLFNEDGEGLPLIRIRDLKLGNPQFYTTEEHKKGTIIIPGDILIGMDAEFRPTIWSGKKAYLNQRVCQIKSNKDYIHDYYLYELIKPHMQFFEFSKVGTTVIHLGKSDIDSIKVIIPNTNYLESFSNIVAPLHDKLVSLSIENRKLRKIRDILLPKLMSGEIRVPLDEEGNAS